MIRMNLQLFGGRGGRSNMSSSTSEDNSSVNNQSDRVRWAARNGAENNSQYRLDYTETVSGNTWKLDGQPKGRRSERGNARAEITPNTDGGFTVRRWGKDGSQLERQTFNNIGPALQTTKTYLRSGYKRT